MRSKAQSAGGRGAIAQHNSAVKAGLIHLPVRVSVRWIATRLSPIPLDYRCCDPTGTALSDASGISATPLAGMSLRPAHIARIPVSRPFQAPEAEESEKRPLGCG